MASPQAALDRGLRYHKAGNLLQAEQEYRRALRIDPSHAEALHLMGFVEQQKGRPETAVDYLQRAVKANPWNAVYQSNLGAALKLVGRLAEAAESFRKAIQLKPTLADAHYNLAIVLDGLGDKPGCVESYRRAIQCDPSSTDALNNLGNVLGQLGELAEAERCFEQSLRVRSDHAQTYFNLGNILVLQGRLDEALERYEHALRLDPDSVDARFNRAVALLKAQRTDEAVEEFRRVVALRPEHADAQFNLGVVLSALSRFREAVEPLGRAVELRPGWSAAWQQLGLVRAALGEADAAIASYKRALAAEPALASGWNNLGLTYLSQRQLEMAERAFCEALGADPALPEAVYNLGNVYRLQGRMGESRAQYERAIALRPQMGMAWLNLGVVCEILEQYGEAKEAFRRAIELQPELAEAHTNLGLLAKAEGRIAAAGEHFAASLRSQPNPLVKLFAETLLPPIYDSLDDLRGWRGRIEANIARLAREGVRVASDRDPLPTVFYLPYHGLNDRDLQRQIARLYRDALGVSAELAGAEFRTETEGGAGKLRVGFISRFFGNHTIGRLTEGLVGQLSREQFEVVVFSLLPRGDEIGERIRSAADVSIELPGDLGLMRKRIAAEQLDVLFYTDLGMDPATFTLALSRLAPVQCATWGHPVTTGIDTIDYFVSSALIEPDDAAGHYTETLVRLARLPAYYLRPVLGARKTKRDFGIPENVHVYLCPQSLFKFHPDFDGVLGEILRRDPAGRIVLVSARFQEWNQQLLARWQRSIPDVVDRVQFVPQQAHGTFLGLVAAADVVLDPLHFGGGNTTYESLAMGTPVVTLPAAFMRGRVTLGCYRQMGVEECVAGSVEEYIAKAVRLGTDAAYRERVSAEIRARSGQLFEDGAAVRELEAFFISAVGKARGAGGWSSSVERSVVAEAGLEMVEAAACAAPSAAESADGAATIRLSDQTEVVALGGRRSGTASRVLGDVLRSCTCPACGHHVAVPFFDGGMLPLTTLAWPKSSAEAVGMKPLPHDFLRCVDCGHVYNARFEYAEVPYSEKPNLMFNKGLIWTDHLRAMCELVLRHTPAEPVVVEVGCGEGHLLRAVAQARPGGRYIGFDPNGAIGTGGGLIEARQELFRPETHLAELRPDLVISRHVLEHLMNPLSFVQAMAFSASWHGVEARLLIEVPCIDGVFRSGRTVDFFYEHNSHFTRTSLTRLLQRCASELELVDTGYNGEVVFGLARFRQRFDQVQFAREALDFRDQAERFRESVRRDLEALAASGKRVAVWGGTGKAAAFMNQYGVDAGRFPVVVDSDVEKAGTYVPGQGQLIRFRDVLLEEPADVILIATQWRAHDIALEIERAGIRCEQILIEHGGRLIDFFAAEHPYRKPARAA